MSEAVENKPNELVAGKYRLVRIIGQGGMGSVWEGEHISLGTRVAIKFIEMELAQSDEARTRFDQEARAAAKLQSRYVVGVFDHGIMPDGRPFIVMEYLAGETLEERVVARGRMTIAETAPIISQVARGLSKAHNLGIVHRDLKPENIFLADSPDDDEQVAKVVDFGIAKFTDGSPNGMSSSTRTGTILGTPVYMSPEQARGLRNIDHRSDLWALGVVVYRCCVGRLPFEGQAVGDIVVKICTQDPVPPSSIDPSLPRSFDAWFARCVARDPVQRFSSAKELASELMVVAGLITTSRQAFISSSAVSSNRAAPSDEMTHLPAPSVSSKVKLENAATQMGAAAPIQSKPKSSFLRFTGVVVAFGSVLMVVVGFLFWRVMAPSSSGDESSSAAVGIVAASAAVGIVEPDIALEKPTSTPTETVASAFLDASEEVPEAGVSKGVPPKAEQPQAALNPKPGAASNGSQRASARTPTTATSTQKKPQPPPSSTETVDLGY